MPVPFESTFPGSLIPVTCPGCHEVLPGPVELCPRCAYSAWTCVDHFPYSPPPLDRYIDVESRLSNEDRARIDRSIEALERDLPQVRVYVCLVKLLPGTDVRECGFWMFNASVPRDEAEAAHRAWSVLLLIDTGASAAGATVGYGLDSFVSDAQLRYSLRAGQADWIQGNFGAGVLKFVQHTHQVLRQAHRSAVRHGKGKASGTHSKTPAFSRSATAHPES